MIKPNKLKPIEIGFGESKIIIYPRMASIAEENDVQERFNEIADADHEKWQKQYEICREALGEFSEEMPATLVKEKGEYKPVKLEGNTPTDALNKFFAERTVENERTVRDAFWLIKSQWSSDSRFL